MKVVNTLGLEADHQQALYCFSFFFTNRTPAPKSSVGSTKLPHLQPWSRAAPFYLRYKVYFVVKSFDLIQSQNFLNKGSTQKMWRLKEIIEKLTTRGLIHLQLHPQQTNQEVLLDQVVCSLHMQFIFSLWPKLSLGVKIRNSVDI